MQIQPSKIERYFARYEFSVRYMLSASDCESWSLEELLGMADTESRALWDGLWLGYTESNGHPLLRAEIAAHYQGIAPEQVLVAAPEELIFIAMNVLLQPGDHVIAVAPAYQSLHEIARSVGATVTPWRLTSDAGAWQLDFDELEREFTPRTKLVVVNFPHNPTGYVPTRGQFERLLNWARERDMYLFSDEMYRLLEHNPVDRLPSACERYDKAITLAGMSKVYGLPGLRIGWLATHATEVLEQCQAFKDYTTICNSAPSEILALMGLRAGEQLLARNRALVHNNLELARAFFDAHRDMLDWIEPDGSPIAFPRWTGPGTVDELAQRLLAVEVCLLPGSIFDYPGAHFRLGLGRKNFSEALERIMPGG